jgi:putative YphP/YqiW family bacilliredoxin
MYDENMVSPMRKELVDAGFQELREEAAVDEAMKQSGTTLVVVNSVCGCAAGGARPGVKLSLQGAKKPDRLYTVFAGQDKAATEKARSYMIGYRPTSPSAALFKDGKLVHMVQRLDIEGHSPAQIAENLQKAYETFC